MNTEWTRGRRSLTLALVALLLPMHFAVAENWDGTVIKYGKMHEAIGKQQHHGRVQLRQLVERPHFYAVAALEKLQGEITVHNGAALITRVGPGGRLQSDAEESALNEQATMLVGAYVPQWKEHTAARDVPPHEVEKHILGLARDAGINAAQPFPFMVEGELTDLRMHVIHGACPMHARLNKIDLPPQVQPVEADYERVQGTLIGIFAEDAVGDITHPATSTHTHVVLQTDPPQRVTGHVERFGLAAGCSVRLPLVHSQ